MRFKAFLSAVAATVLTVIPFRTDACTNILVTKGASTDGSCLISYAADSHWLYGDLYFQKASDHKGGAMRKVVEWDTWKPLGEIPQISHTYRRVGNMNEHQLIIGETTFGGREELVDPEGKMDYGSMIFITLERARTAREAIEIMVGLANEYGYCSEGETFSIADTREVWIMDLIGKGSGNKGVVWVARRIPEGYICAHANQSRIGRFPLDDPQNCLYAEDVISFARGKGYFSGEDSEFSFCKTYAPADFGTVRGCDARAWAAFNLLGDGVFTFIDETGKEISRPASDWLNYAMGLDPHNPMPLFIKPSRKISVKNVADAMRDHYEGTPMDMTTDIGAGGNALPYRWRPMEFEYEGKTYVNERAIATQQTGFWFVGQSRGHIPNEIGGILWFGCDDAATSWLTPIYTCTTKVPECFRAGNGDLLHYSPTSAFWMCNRVTNHCYKMYNQMAPYVRKKVDAFENSQMGGAVQAMDEKALKAFKKNRIRKIRRMLTKYTVQTAQKQFNDWVKLEETLLVKFIDGNVKAQNEDGSFKHSIYNEGVPSELTQPGYTEKWKEAVVKDHGPVILVRE